MMTQCGPLFAAALLLALSCARAIAGEPLKLHPEKTGKLDKTERVNSTGGSVALNSFGYSQDIALSIKRLRSR
jgi:hypothetical protein